MNSFYIKIEESNSSLEKSKSRLHKALEILLDIEDLINLNKTNEINRKTF